MRTKNPPRDRPRDRPRGRWAVAALAALVAAACAPGAATPPECPEGTKLSGNQCAPDVELAPPDDRELIPPPDAGTPPPPPPTDGGGGGAVSLPFFIEDHYVMSGFFSETGGASFQRSDCSDPGTLAGASCIRIDFTPNGDTFGGVFFQHPENNFGAQPGLAIPPGAQQVRFRAWGVNGGESVKFGAGVDNDEPFSDGFNVEVAHTLTTTPTEYFVDLRNVAYTTVAGGFFWVAETPTGTGEVSFFMDNIEWTAEDPVDVAVPIPFWVDDHYLMSGFFPGPPATVQVTEECTGFSGTDPDSVCRRITLTPNGQTFAGFFFQFPENNFGAQPGKLIAQGATRITFRAWGETGAEIAKFGAGLDNDLPNEDGWNIETAEAALPTTPTEFSIDISGITYDRVAGAFLWVLNTADGATPRTFYLDNVRWE